MTTGQDQKQIKRAIVSLYTKEPALPFCAALKEHNVEIVASGGTADFLTKNGFKVVRVGDITRFHDILGGRVKTLHPAIFGGILARRNNEHDLEELQQLGLEAFDLVLVNLYPFHVAVEQKRSLDQAVELIDIGGSALIRAAAKNFHDVTVIVDNEDLAAVEREFRQSAGSISFETRLRLAGKAFQTSAAYDTSISKYLCSAQQTDHSADRPIFPEHCTFNLVKETDLKYGENPHQAAACYRVMGDHGNFARFTNVADRPLSFNNMFDLFAAYELAWEYDQPAAAIIKHASPCGVACQDTLIQAYEAALACDPASAYGSIIALNRAVDYETAEKLHETQFIEAVVAPMYEEKALELLMKKKKRRFITCPEPRRGGRPNIMYRWIGGAFLAQTDDELNYEQDKLEVVTERQPTELEMKDLMFAWSAVKHVRSNAILLAKNGATIGIGAGQTSRVDSVMIALHKAGDRVQGSVLASDAFFPFRDSIDMIHDKGITALIQPGGSIRDEEVIQACNEYNLAMIFTGLRHFRHQ
ncbi:bifunctional phosphoribosylaminoimidazolecarboxamide formyltransferase/IMP cyclohydrolase [bacterium]|nr:bifunctional phosphoribosylaminoimidazolecarboxamide formyltransferase/IMP cyclohydrolase [bacterium]